jgi:amino acid transporter
MSFSDLDPALREAFSAWTKAPQWGNLKLIADLPALGIVVFITWLVYKGINESKIAGNIMVLLKTGILLLVIAVGSFYVQPSNWSPFAPNGIGGVLKGISGVFFAYIGFDAISTTAEECRNPQRDLPRSMIYSLIITTILYVATSLVLTGMVPFSQLGVSDPLAFAFEKVHLTRLSGFIALSAIIAMASVLLVFQLGQPRIWMSMSRDGLLPPRFSKLHPKYRTPAFATIVTGIVVAIPSLFMNLTEVTDLTSIGTLFAFILVSGGVLVLHPRGISKDDKKTFRIPYLNCRWYLIPVWIFVLLLVIGSDSLRETSLSIKTLTFANFLSGYFTLTGFVLVALITTYFAIVRQWSLIPVLGLLTNLYLMSQLGLTNWMRFLIWLAVGLVIYFGYGVKHSKLRNI